MATPRLPSLQRLLFGARAELAEIRRRSMRAGLRAVAPALLALIVWGLVTGVAMVKSGMSTLEAIGMSLLVFAGSAQLAVLPLIAADAPVWVALLTALVINLRFVIISASLWPYFRRYSMARRTLLGYLTADLGAAIFLSRFARPPADAREATEQVWYLLGIAAGAWATWQGSSIAGVFLAGGIPGEWGLEFAAILALIAVTVPMVNGAPLLAGALATAAVSVVAFGLPYKLGLVAAVFAGIVVSMTAEVVQERGLTGH
jgi:predicted branched-subunit amino acid permease